jgi:putative ABC transport system permease protein
MFVFNLRSSFRNILKDKLFAFFNLSGFALGFTVCILLSLFIFRELTVDREFKNYKNIFKLIDTVQNMAKMDCDIALALKENFPDIIQSSPVFYYNMNPPQYIKKIQGSEFVMIKELISTNNDFFRIFSLNILIGDKNNPFSDLNSIVLTESTALKIFGKIDVLGEVVRLEKSLEVHVSAVVQDIPENSSLNADLFFNSENEMFRFSQSCNGGVCFNPSDVYVLKNPKVGINNLKKIINSKFPTNKSNTKGILLQPLKEIYLTQGIKGNINRIGSIGLITIFITIAVLVMLMSVVNYVNFTLLRQLNAMKSLGIRIANGANTRQLKGFYLTDTTLSVLISFLLALYLASAILPFVETLLGSDLNFYQIFSWQLLILYSSVILIVIMVSILAPLYLLKNADVQMLFGKKNLKLGKRTGQKLLTVFQIFISSVLLISLILIQKQLHYVKTADLGFNKELLLKLELPRDFKNYSALKQQIDNLSFVKSSSFSEGSPGTVRIGMSVPELDQTNFNCFYIDKQFIDTYGIELLMGREFMDGDLNQSCYINEEAYKRFEWDNLENRKFNNGRVGGYSVIGVVRNFNVTSLHKKIEPACLMFSNLHYGTLNIRLLPGNLEEEMNKLREVWESFVPGSQINYTFLDEYFDALYHKEEQQGKTIALFTIIAFIITCLGLIGQILQISLNRTKEIGIKRVNGATVKEIIMMLNKEFMISVLIAYLAAVPVSIIIMNIWLENFAYKISQSIFIYVLAGILIVAVVLFTVSIQSWRAATQNPVEALRYE